MTFDGFPFIFGWELTLACNLACRHCGSSAGLPRKNELTFEESIAICDQLPQLLVQEVNFTGGEPLLRSEWWKIAQYIAKSGINPKLITNGLTLNPETVNRMKDCGIAGVGVSVDGLEATHDFIRGHNGLFQHVLKGIELLLKAGIPLTILTTANSLNIKELPPLFQVLVSAGVTRWQIQPLFPLGRSLETNELLLNDETVIQLGKFIKDWTPKAVKAGMEMLPGDSFGYFTGLDIREPPWRGCPAGQFSCGITSDGMVKGCLSLPDEFTEGDVRKDDLWDIWFHPDSFEYTRKYSKEMLGSFCKSCDKADQCQGGCSSMSFGGTGGFHNDPYCFTGIRMRST